MIGASHSRWPIPALLIPIGASGHNASRCSTSCSIELERVGDDQDPQSRITLRDVADQVSDDHALAGRGRHHHERIAAAARPVILQRGERFLLVWTQLEH